MPYFMIAVLFAISYHTLRLLRCLLYHTILYDCCAVCYIMPYFMIAVLFVISCHTLWLLCCLLYYAIIYHCCAVCYIVSYFIIAVLFAILCHIGLWYRYTWSNHIYITYFVIVTILFIFTGETQYCCWMSIGIFYVNSIWLTSDSYNSLAPLRCSNFKSLIYKHMLHIEFMSPSC